MISTASSGTARLHVEDSGAADSGSTALVCLHAGVADRRMWGPQQAALGAGRRVIAYDRRGFGETGCDPEPFSHVGDLMAVLGAAGLRDAVLMGCSQGGRIAIDAALAHPDRVRALVLVANGITGAPKPAHFAPATQARLDALARAEERDDFDAVNELEAQLWLDGPEEPAGRIEGPLRGLFTAMNAIALSKGAPYKEIPPPPAWDRLAELDLPVLVVWGSLDFEYIRAQMRLLVQKVKGAKSLVIDGTAHLPNLERPEVFNAAVVRFLAGL